LCKIINLNTNNLITNNTIIEEINMSSSREKLQKGNLKVGEIYMNTLKEYQKKFDKNSLAVFMQVGSFFEMYGFIHKDGSREGNVWEISDQLGLKVANKEQLVYGDPSIQMVMAGVPEVQINKFIQMAVEKYNWTVVIFEQKKIGNGSRYERVETGIYSPGININSDSVSNICMNIYIEQIKNYFSLLNSSQNLSDKSNNSSIIKSNIKSNNDVINIGLSYVDTLSGENGIMDISNHSIKDTAIPFDELLKILTIKKPNEIILNLINCDISDEDLINALHLFKFNFKIIRNGLDDKYDDIKYQRELFTYVYSRQKGVLDILQQLDIEDIRYIHARKSLVLLIDYIIKHDKNVINKLSKPNIIVNSDYYLMLANNCLEQLDIIDNYKQEYQKNNEYGLGKRISLCEMLDRTKTPMGRRMFRQRLSIPITDSEELNNRYSQVEDFVSIENKYIKYNKDIYGSPLSKIRQVLTDIKNVDNYMRKMITNKFHPCELDIFYDSIKNCIKLKDVLLNLKRDFGSGFGISNEYANSMDKYVTNNNNTNTNTNTNTNHKQNSYLDNIIKLIPSEKCFNKIEEMKNKIDKEIMFDKCGRSWVDMDNNIFKTGVFSKLDKIQDGINLDRNLVDSLLDSLQKLIKKNKSSDTNKLATSNISKSDNAKLGIHLHTNTSNKDILEKYCNEKKNKVVLTIGQGESKYEFYGKDFSFSKMKESKWQINATQLKISGSSLKQNIEYLVSSMKKCFSEWINKLINEYIVSLEELSTFVSNIDVIQSIAYVSIKKGYVKPEIKLGEHSYINAKQIRHPIIEHIHKNTKYVPNDILLGNDDFNQVGMLLFGINAVGKSSCMKSIGINIIMAQAGMYVACDSMIYHPYNYLFTRIKNNDNLYAGLSSFEVEMKEFKVILRYADQNSIILGDELCSGTETQDATALVASGVIQLSQRKSSFIFATHLHFLADMPYIKNLNNVKLYHLLVEKDPKDPTKLIYTRKLQPGNGPKSYGILVCESMCLDNEFINLAKEIRSSMDNEKEIVNIDYKNSKYNQNKSILYCEICQLENSNSKIVAEDVHHINMQCTANNSGMIGNFHKNEKWNLVSLCKKCHQDVHSSPSKLKINGYLQTNNGIELSFERLIKNRTNTNTNVNKTTIEQSDNSDNNETISKKETNKNNIKKSNDDVKRLKIIDMIKEMKKEGHGTKKIQNKIKTDFGLKISQSEIREIC
jgi:DNA mismatch repair protein MutS